MQYNTPCTPATPCHKHRYCDHCAALRQRRIAEIAATRHRGGVVTFATLTHLSGPAVATARQLHPGTGGMWSVEAGTKMGGLHVNLLFESQHALFAEEIAARAALPNAEVWAKTVPAADLRNVAAYINKREGMPRAHDYRGNLYGAWGSWRSLRQVAQEQTLAPLLAAASHEDQLRRLDIEPGTDQYCADKVLIRPSERTLTRDDYRSIALQNLPILRQILGS